MGASELVVMESGAHWPLWASQSGIEGFDRIVVADGPGAALVDLARRALSRLSRFEVNGRPLRRAILALAPSPSGEATNARHLLSRALLTHMALNGHGQLIFATPDPLDATMQRDLLSLVESLTQRFAGTGVTVSLRVGEGKLAMESPPVSHVRSRRPTQVRPAVVAASTEEQTAL